MKTDVFLEQLRSRLTPDPFDICANEEMDLLLTRKSRAFSSGAYAFAVFRLDESQDIHNTVNSARTIIKNELCAMWCFREIGLYLVLLGACDIWEPQVSSVKTDKTGLHAVIIQGIHFVDAEKGIDHSIRSQWGPVTFGGKTPVWDIVSGVLKSEYG